MTALDLIKAALRELQVLGDDVVLTDAETQYAMEALNMMLDSWSNDSMLIYHVEMEQFSTIANHNPHTWGTGGDFNSVRPIRLLAAKVRDANNIDLDLPIMSYNDYAEVKDKLAIAAYPQRLYYDNGWPNGSIYFYPVPSAIHTVTLWSEKPLQSATDIYTVLSYPPGYFEAIKYNLALRLAPEYQLGDINDVRRLAEDSLLLIARQNRHMTTMQVSPILNRQTGRTAQTP